MVKKKRLGRGLDALLGGSRPPGEAMSTEDDLRQIAVDRIDRGRFQPRTDMQKDTLEELAASIRAQGVVQPIVVRPVAGERFEIIAGERRWRAAQMAGLHDIPAVVRIADDRATIAMALIENIQREDLNPLDEARALDRLMREFGLTQQDAADAVGRSRSAVANLLRLQELNEDVRNLVESGQLDMGHARTLLGLTGPAQSQAAREVVKKGLSVRGAEALVRRLAKGAGKKRHENKDKDANIRALEDDLAGRLGARVMVQPSGKGKGKLIIEYHSLDELDGILAKIR